MDWRCRALSHGAGWVCQHGANRWSRVGCTWCLTLSVSRAEDYMRRIGCPQWIIDRSLRAGDDQMRSYQMALQAGAKIAMGTDMLPADAYDGTGPLPKMSCWKMSDRLACGPPRRRALTA
jgi:hypothetical protein